MKPQLKFLLAVTAVLGSALAVAQDEKPPTPAPPATPPTTAITPPGAVPTPPQPDQHPLGGRHGRHGPDGAGTSGQPDGQGQQTEQRREHFRHSEGDRPEGARNDGPGRDQHPQPPPQKPVPYIGVATSPVPPIVASQLNLPENFGLVVDGVLPNSPAATAGLQKFDVLKLYNDQQIVDPRQLAILVHATGKDGSATLTLFRKGQEQKISIKVGEGVLPNMLGSAHHGGDAEHGPGHQGFDHPRFGGNDFGHHGRDQQRLSREGAEHQNFGEEGHHHHPDFGGNGFEHHGFDHRGENGAEHHGSDHHEFAERGPGRGDFEGRGPDRHGFPGNGFEHHGFDHPEFGHDGFSQRHGDQRNFDHQGPGHFGPDHQQPTDRAGRQPGNRDQSPENRHRDFQMRREGWQQDPSTDSESPSAPLSADLESDTLPDQSNPTAEPSSSAQEAIRQELDAIESQTQAEAGLTPAIPAEGELGNSDLADATVI